MHWRPRAALRHSKGVGVQASSLRCLFDRTTHGHASEVGLSRVRPQHRNDACSQQTLHALLVHIQNVCRRGICSGGTNGHICHLECQRAGVLSAYAPDSVSSPPAALASIFSRSAAHEPGWIQVQDHFALVHSSEATHVLSKLSKRFWFTAKTPLKEAHSSSRT